jgi:hypothetical protein
MFSLDRQPIELTHARSTIPWFSERQWVFALRAGAVRKLKYSLQGSTGHNEAYYRVPARVKTMGRGLHSVNITQR